MENKSKIMNVLNFHFEKEYFKKVIKNVHAQLNGLRNIK